MSQTPPKSLLNRSRSGFTMIDPLTGLFYHKKGGANHVAISYVWAEWKSSPADLLPDWSLLQPRLQQLVGPASSSFMKVQTGHRTNCWLDSKCIDQASQQDKAFWIPRMDEIYDEARCTVLLLRNIDLRPLVQAEARVACAVDTDGHSCLQTQACTSMTDFTDLSASKMIETLAALFDGTWRKRAWIFQEILLSREYTISGDLNQQIKLSDIGVIAGILAMSNPEIFFLSEFAEWCRRLYWLRHRYSQYKLCIANILQIAGGLEATVPADKYYALCGIPRLKSIEYNSRHSAAEALQSIILALTQKGRMSWLYAIPSDQESKSLQMRDEEFIPYVGQYMFQDGSFYSKPYVERDFISFAAIARGLVEKAESISSFLQQGTNYNIPRLIFKLGFESVSTLTVPPLLNRLKQVFHLDENESSAELLWHIYSIKPDIGIPENVSDTVAWQMAVTASANLKEAISALESTHAVITWSRSLLNNRSGLKRNAPVVSIGLRNTPVGTNIFQVRGDKILFAAEIVTEEGAYTDIIWRGAVMSLSNEDTKFSSKEKFERIGATIFARKSSPVVQLRLTL